MATVGEIRAQVQFYLQSTAMTQGQSDIFLLELNSARARAERLHDFAVSLQNTTASVSPSTGADLTNLTYTGGHRFKALLDAAITVGGYNHPLDIMTKHGQQLELRDQNRRKLWDYQESTRSETSSSIYAPRILLEGNTMYLHPTPTAATTVSVTAYTWFPDYEDDDDSDWFTETGADYLKWATIVSLNHHFQVFVPRQEGSLSPPERAMNEALETMIRFDVFTPLLSGTFHP